MEVTPRNTLVLIELNPLPKTRKEGAIEVTNADRAFCTGTVRAVPAGLIVAQGGQHETSDLKVGDVVLVQHKKVVRGPKGYALQDEGIKLSTSLTGQDNMRLFEQTNVLCILDGEIPEDYLVTTDELPQPQQIVTASPIVTGK